MKTSSFKNAFLMALLGVSVAACNKPGGCDPSPEGCRADLVCTADFRTITISIKDSAGNPVALDEYKTVRQRGGTVFSQTEDAATEQDRRHRGEYPVAGDNLLRQTRKDGEAFDFYGYKNGAQVIRRTYFIGHDCCHVLEKDGNGPSVAVVLPN